MNEQPVYQSKISVLSAFRFMGWFFALAIPWATAFVLFNWVWAPDFFSKLNTAAIVTLILTATLVTLLLASWRVNNRNKILRVLLMVLAPLNLIMACVFILFMKQAYEPITSTHQIKIRNQQYTFYMQQYRTWGTFLAHDGCTRIWIRKGDDRILVSPGEAVFNVALIDTAIVNGDKVRFYFRDESVFQKQGDQYLEYEASTGFMYNGSADSIPADLLSP